MEFLAPNKKQKSVDLTLCIICQTKCGETNYANYISNPTLESIRKVMDSAKSRFGYGEMQFKDLTDHIANLSAEDLMQSGVSFHKKCYQDLTHKEKLERARKRYEKGRLSGDVKMIRQKTRGRPPTCLPEECPSTSSRTGRQIHFDKDMCVLCQETKEDSLHEVCTANMGSQLKDIGEKTRDKNLKTRLGVLVIAADPLSAVAYDMKYHLACLTNAKRDIVKCKDTQTLSDNTFAVILSDLEILQVVEYELNDPRDTVLNMNDVNVTYINILQGNGFQLPENPQYKQYLKTLILGNIPDVHFNRPKVRNQPEQLLSTKAKETAIANAMTHVKEDLEVLLKAATILRKEMGNSREWKFQGTFTDYTPPPLLYTLCKHVIQGTKRVHTARREVSISNSVSILAQHFVQAYRSDRQLYYTPKNQDNDFKNHTETPLAVGLALDMHKVTRSKLVVSKLESLDIGISYAKVMEIETSLANYVLKQMDSTGGLCLPSWLVKNRPVWFAMDNIDFLEATPSGINTLHGTALAVFQPKAPDMSPVVPTIDRTSKSRTLNNPIDPQILSCSVPRPEKQTFPCKLNKGKHVTQVHEQADFAWVVGSLNFDHNEEHASTNRGSGTWGAFNSLLLEQCSHTLTNVGLLPPLIRSPPTNYDTFYTGLMKAQGTVMNVMGPENLTVVTLDLQLYDMAMKLWVSRDDIKAQFLFRPGELHIVFWALCALGKYVEASGIDQAWVEAGLYSPTTVNQILNGKHLYRALEAHMVTLLTLYDLYFKQFLALNPEERIYLQEAAGKLKSSFQSDISSAIGDRGNLEKALSESMEIFESRDLTKRLLEFEANANKIQLYILNYLKQFKTVLQFIRATRKKDFVLHMESIESLIKYFFAHDHLNYARLLPLYLASMQQTNENHPEVWYEFMDGNFCVSKGFAAFTSIAPDHAIEHENRKLKVVGGIVGITQNEKALERFFLISPELSKIVDAFENEYCMVSDNKRREHHEVTGTKLKRLLTNAQQLKQVIAEHGDPFAATEEDLFNLLTKEVMGEKVTEDILNRDTIGQQMFENFVKERLNEGKSTVWDHMKKRNIGTFKSANIAVEVKSGDKIMKIKEERGLLQRFVLASRSRPELDLKECIGKYEFGLIPRALFAADGLLLLAYDKAKVLHHLEKMGTETVPEICSVAVAELVTGEGTDILDAGFDMVDQVANSDKHHVLLIDGMALVNSIHKTDQIKTCSDFATVFLERLVKMTATYSETRLVFDRYMDGSLKQQMRNKRTKGMSTYYHITDSTLIRNISLRQLLSNIKTKDELTLYLAAKTLEHSTGVENKLKSFLVTAGTNTNGNVDVPDTLRTHSQEEADTLLLLHALTIGRDSDVVIYSPDTDVFLLMLYLYPMLPRNLSFLTGQGKLQRMIPVKPIYDALGPKRAAAILGFHAFTGSDLCGRFAGRTKDWCFKVFLECDDDILDALASLGCNEATPSVESLSSLERFVCLLYKSKSHEKVDQLRWFLFSNRQAEGEHLPPTLASLTPHILRAHYITMIWRRSSDCHPCLPPVTDYGWNKVERILIPERCLNPPAPDAILKLVKCGCKKGCKANCSCRKNKIPCTEMCRCIEYTCLNSFVDRTDPNIVGGDDDDDA